MKKRIVYLSGLLAALLLYMTCYHYQQVRYNNIVYKHNAMAESFNQGISKYREIVSLRDFLRNTDSSNSQGEVAFEQEITTNFLDIFENHLAGDTFFKLYDRIVDLRKRTDDLSERLCIVQNYPKAVEDTFLIFRDKYNDRVKEYNKVVSEYRRFLDRSSVDSLEGFHSKDELFSKEILTSDFSEWCANKNENELDNMMNQYRQMLVDMDNSIYEYLVVKQITAPTSEWIVGRLKNIKEISGMEIITAENDLNRLLGKDGYYKACVYFSSINVKNTAISEKPLIKCGTDAGGSIEVFDNSSDALERCKYLAEFDDTLLYTGSYVVAGTMVIRTSCFLSDEQQLNLTNNILEEFTKVTY